MLHRARSRALWAWVGLAPLLAAGCRHPYSLENRDTPVHVWLTAPEAAARGDTVEFLVYVGDKKAIEGPVRFPPGVPNVIIPAVYLRAGPHTVSVVVGRGRASARREIEVAGETWLRVTLAGNGVRVDRSSSEPPAPRATVTPFLLPAPPPPGR